MVQFRYLITYLHMYCKGKKHAEHISTRICSDLYIYMFFSFLALMVRAFIWCWSRLTWKIMSTWCRFSMLGQRDDAHFSICCTDRFGKLELFEGYKTSVRTPRKLRSHVQSTCQARSLSINFCSFLQLEVIESENY